MNSRVDQKVDFCGQMGVSWTCERKTLTSFLNAAKKELYREKKMAHVCNHGYPRPFEIADSNITNIFIRTSREYFTARCPLSVFFLNRAVTALDEDLRLAGKQLWNMVIPMPSIAHMARIPGKSLLFFVWCGDFKLEISWIRFSIPFSFKCVFFSWRIRAEVKFNSKVEILIKSSFTVFLPSACSFGKVTFLAAAKSNVFLITIKQIKINEAIDRKNI